MGTRRRIGGQFLQYLKGAIGSLAHHAIGAHETLFQYLKGAIGSGLDLHLFAADGVFQYLKGAIGSSEQCGGTVFSWNFQYLKGAIGSRGERSCGRGCVDFQYLKGAIGSSIRRRTAAAWMLLSIPQRCDWKTVFFDGKKGREMLSIPQRCDWKPDGQRDPPESLAAFNTSKVRLEVRQARALLPPVRLSIPQRCDWKCPAAAPSRLRGRRFQYLKGAIGSNLGLGYSPFCEHFQYLKGAIGSTSASAPGTASS